MKKLSIFFGLLMLFGICGCRRTIYTTSSNSSISINSSKENTSEVHKHNFNQKVPTEQYLAKAATCTEPARYYYSCKCGEKGTEIFEYGEPLGHDWTDWEYHYRETKDGTDIRIKKCKKCGKTITEEIEFTNNLCFSVTSETDKTAKVLGYRKFYNDDRDTKIVIPETWNGYTITQIAPDAFVNNSIITSVSISKFILKIGERAFSKCTSMKSLLIDDDCKLKSIGNGAFSGCDNLTSILNCPKSLVNIGDYAFALTKLSSVILNVGITHIGNYAFAFSKISGELVIPETVNEVGVYAFSYTDISSLVIKGLIQTVGDSAFSDNSSLKFATIEKDWTKIYSCMFLKCRNLENVTMPDSILEFEDLAFNSCLKLENFVLPPHLKKIGRECFGNCHSLKKLIFPKSTDEIGDFAFMNCKSLSEISYYERNDKYYIYGNMLIEFGESSRKLLLACGTDCVIPTGDYFALITTLCGYSFSEATITVTIPTSVTQIDECAFCHSKNLTDVFYQGTEDQFKKISIGKNNEPFKKAKIHYNQQ